MSTMVSKEMCLNNNIIDGVLYCDGAYKISQGVFGCRLVDEVIKYESVEISKAIDETLISDDVKIASGLTKDQADWCLRCMAFPNFEADVPLIYKKVWLKRLLSRKGIPDCGFYAKKVL